MTSRSNMEVLRVVTDHKEHIVMYAAFMYRFPPDTEEREMTASETNAEAKTDLIHQAPEGDVVVKALDDVSGDSPEVATVVANGVPFVT